MKLEFDKSKITVDGNKVIIEVPDAAALEPLRNAGKVLLSSLSPGDTFPIGDETFIVLEHTSDGTRVISEGFAYNDEEFGDSSHWMESPIREKLHGEYLKKIAAIIGGEHILAMERDLTSLDGLDDYGECKDYISLLTAAEYAKYHKILGLQPEYENWWWTITPASTPSNGYSRNVCYVASYGILRWDGCGGGSDVRPFLTLDSSILVLAE